MGHGLTFVEMNEENGQEERCREYRRPKHGQDLPQLVGFVVEENDLSVRGLTDV